MGLRSAALLLVSLPMIAAQAPDATALERLTQYLGGLSSLRADFRQSVADSRGQIIEQSEGTMVLARPGRFRWDYRRPEQSIICDGVSVWLYDVELQQVTVKAADTALTGSPAMLLSGDGDIAAEFSVADAGRADELSWSVLTPRRADADFREVRLGFDRGVLRRMILLDRLGQSTELDFTRIERNPRLDRSLFNFEPPPGVDVVGKVPAG